MSKTTATITTESGKTYDVEVRCSPLLGRWDVDAQAYAVTGRYRSQVSKPGRYHMASATADTAELAIAQAMANAKKVLEKNEALHDIYPAAKAVAADLDGAKPADGQTAADFFVGQRVAVWSHNRRRVGLVTKVGRTNITAAVVVASSGNLVTATSKFAHTVILDTMEGR
jgi:hypothetical protein